MLYLDINGTLAIALEDTQDNWMALNRLADEMWRQSNRTWTIDIRDEHSHVPVATYHGRTL